MTGEDRLRALMRDPGWSLPPWPDATRRIRRAARRQRAVAAGTAAAVVVALAAAAVSAGALIRPARAPVAIKVSHRASPPSPSPSPTTSRIRSTPPVGSPGFPASIYPAAVRPRQSAGTLALCPDPAGLEAPGPATPAAATVVLRHLVGGFRDDLHVSDRSAWPYLARRWHSGGIELFANAERAGVRYSGPLRPGAYLPAGLVRSVMAQCGAQVAGATWVIVTRGAHILFVTRRNHMLFYSVA